MKQRPHVILAASIDRAHGAFSGYTAICNHVDANRTVLTHRAEGRGMFSRLGNALASRIGCSTWAKLGSLTMEKTLRAVSRTTSNPIIHLLWADRDWIRLDKTLRYDCKLIGTFHQPPAILKQIIRYPVRLKRFDKIILMSRSQSPFFEAAGVEQERLSVVYHGVDTEFFCPPSPLHNDGSVICVGSYLRDFQMLREVARRLTDETSFVVVSRPDFRPIFADCPNVKFLTGLSDEQLLARYQSSAASLMVVKDATANNGIMESLSCGLPVVTHSVGGIPEYMDDSCGFVTGADDIEAMVDGIRRLTSDEGLRQQLGSNARRRALKYSWQSVGEQHNECYRRVADRD